MSTDTLKHPERTAADLCAHDIGKQITVRDLNDTFTGVVEGIGFDTERTYCGAQATSVRVEFDRVTIRYPLAAVVTSAS